MVVKELIHKVTGRLKNLTGGGDDLEDLEKEFSGKGGVEPELDDIGDLPPEPEPMSEPELEPKPEPEPDRSDVELNTIKNSLENIKGKLELLETHMQTLESKDEFHRAEADRYIQYLTFINEKLDHLEREHSEIESLIQRRTR